VYVYICVRTVYNVYIERVREREREKRREVMIDR
jgi:hypothetical protein